MRGQQEEEGGGGTGGGEGQGRTSKVVKKFCSCCTTVWVSAPTAPPSKRQVAQVTLLTRSSQGTCRRSGAVKDPWSLMALHGRIARGGKGRVRVHCCSAPGRACCPARSDTPPLLGGAEESQGGQCTPGTSPSRHEVQRHWCAMVHHTWLQAPAITAA